MLNKNIPVHSARKLSWEGDTGTAEISTFAGPLREGMRTHSARVWDDACDVGFYVESPRTGSKVLFVLVGTDEDEGDITAFNYQAYDLKTKRDLPFKIVLLND